MFALLTATMRALTHIVLFGLFHVEGRELVPKHGALIVCPNHAATLDPPMVPAFFPRSDNWSMAKSEYFESPVVGRLFRWYHAFPVVRHTADRKALKRSFEILQSNQCLIIFPEGTRVDSGVLAQPEPGAGFIAQRTGCPVLPVALIGTRDCLPKGARWPRRVKVTVRFGPPLVVNQRRPDGTKISHQEASDAIMVAIAGLLLPTQRGAFSDLEAWRSRLEGVSRPA